MFKTIFQFLRLNLNLFGLTSATWLAFALLFTNETSLTRELIIYVVGSAILSVVILDVLNYFHSLRILPRKSDVLLAMIALPIAGIIFHCMLQGYGFPTLFRLREIGLASPFLAMGLFGVHSYFEFYMARRGRKKRIVMALLPHERQELIEHFIDRGYDQYCEFLTISDLKEALLKQNESSIDQVIMSRGAVREFHEDAYLVRAHLAGIPIIDRREISADLTGRIPLSDSDSWSFILTATRQTELLRIYAATKSMLEPLLATLLAVLLSPVLLVTAILIKIKMPGPVFYLQVRTGYLGRTFTLIKFRSMRVDSEAGGGQWATDADSRITPFGKFIRGTRLDELPQLWNVMRGEMSFVGPRPERPEFYIKLRQEIPLFGMRTNIRPGITGWAQVCAGYAATVEESKTKLEFDLFYIKHVSLRLDLIVLIRTLMVAMMGSERAKTMTSPGRSRPSAPAPADGAIH